jgi:NAD(P)-dependent dehydrogenase (short-subunit alcohol dehydrogenase family)
MRDVSGKVAFITGGGSGIGLGMARVFLSAGMKVVIVDCAQAHLSDAVGQIGGRADLHCIRADVTDRLALAAAADEAERVFGRVHILCNNAGIGIAAPMSTAAYSDWDRMFAVNVGGVINGIVTFLPRMRAHGEGGHIVNTSSMAGIIPVPDVAGIYSASKFAVRGISDSLRLSLVDDRIGVTTLFPGLTRSRIMQQLQDEVAAGRSKLDQLAMGFDVAQSFAMDSEVVGRAVLDAIRRNDPYVLAHAEFADEVRALCEELLAAFRMDIPVDPRRVAFEAERRRSIEAIKARLREL